MNGIIWGAIGIAIGLILSGIGSGIGLYKTGTASAGVMAEDGKKFSKIIVLALLPATQGIYGFVLSVIKISALTADINTGFVIFAATVAMGISGMLSAILQGKTAASCIYAIGKNSEGSGKYVLFPAMIEFYAILALVLGIML